MPECCEGGQYGHADDCENYDGAPYYRDGMGPDDPVRCDND